MYDTKVSYEIKEVIKDFKYGWIEFFKYEIVAKIILSIIVIPIFAFFINVLMKNKGFSVITNNQILKFGFSKQGILSLIILYIMAIFVILMEIGGIIVIGNRIITKNKNTTFFSILKFCLIKMKRFIGIGGIFAILFFIIFTNFIGIESYSTLGIPLDPPEFIQSYINESNILKLSQVMLIGLFIILFIRWIFTFHFIVLENKKPMDALRQSGKLVKKNSTLVIKNFIIIFILNTIVISIFYGLWIVIVPKIIYHINYNTYFGKVFIASLFLLRKLGVMITFLIITPIQIHWITRLYYFLKLKKHNEKIKCIDLNIKVKYTLLNKSLSNKKVVINLIFIIFIFSSLIIGRVIDTMIDTMCDIKITAHRGSALKAPENTMASIRAAIKDRADFAEIDVQESRDGKIFLCHDLNLKRITGLDKNTWDINYSDIKNLDAGSFFNKNFQGERIPLLKDIIDISRDKIKLNIEIKVTGHEKSLVEKVVKIIEDKNFIKSCVVTSLDYDVLQRVKKLNPNIKTGYIIYLGKGKLEELNVDFCSIEESFVSDDIVYKIHSAGKKIHVWTVNDEDNMRKLIDLGVDNIITDDPVKLKKIVADLKNNSKYDKFLEIIMN